MLNRSNRSRFRRLLCALTSVASAALLAASCSVAGTEPDQLLNQTISGLSGTDNFQFHGTTSVGLGDMPMQEGAAFRGAVTGHTRLTMALERGAGSGMIQTALGGESSDRQVVFSRKENGWASAEEATGAADMLLPWSPLYKLEQLNTMDKQVERGRDETKLTVLTVTPDAAEATAGLKEELSRQSEALDTDKKLAELRTKLGLSERQAERLRSELDVSVKRARKLLDEANGSLQAGSVYRIWVDRVSRLPQKMQVETEMTYSADGQPKREKSVIDYEFSSYDQRSG
ncbi:hypothetical protein ACFFNY_00405 [Paenibacillus hodogayensis]|uniref:Lipoprotein n=1 Tax=Paenibacillus hodogayensis TaxID=279208 RepID=A0ABV5VP19_9BACL